MIRQEAYEDLVSSLVREVDSLLREVPVLEVETASRYYVRYLHVLVHFLGLIGDYPIVPGEALVPVHVL